MRFRNLRIPDCLQVSPVVHADDRGTALECLRVDKLEEQIGYRFAIAQSNVSVSARGVLRGINVAALPPGKAKYVTVVHGAVMDYVVDLRVGSPTFGVSDSVLLDDLHHRAIYIPEGVGHAFVAMTETATVAYVTSTNYDESKEFSIAPLDPEIGLQFPDGTEHLMMSGTVQNAPSLADALRSGVLPMYSQYQHLHAGRVNR
jgi:dTDP-4-dehydrorhamnose 3,5-epimerase